MRPHNKSILWNEFLEHPEKAKKYFNTKHKKAFCRRCISQTIDDLDRCQLARARFNNTGGAAGFIEGWEQWKRREGSIRAFPLLLPPPPFFHNGRLTGDEAFDRVEALSGRSSNMQRHIRTCEHIPPGERAHIMANFEATRHPSAPGASGGDSVAHGGSESSSSSSFGSPDMGRQQRQHEFPPRSAGVQQSSPRQRPRPLAPRPEPEPSRKITLQSILNEESEPPRAYQRPGSSSGGSNTRREMLDLRGIGGSVSCKLAPLLQLPPPRPPPLPLLPPAAPAPALLPLPLPPAVPASEAAGLGPATAAEVNSLISRVNQLIAQIRTFREGEHFRVSEDCARTMAQLREQLDMACQDDAAIAVGGVGMAVGTGMGGRVPASGELMRRLDGVEEELSRVVEAYGRSAETGDGRVRRGRERGGEEGGDDGIGDGSRRSTFAWMQTADSETLRRHLGGRYP